VSQTIGLTRVSVSYHRPAVNGRKVWGALVPFDAVWRGGANENTVLTVTSPFTIGGASLPAGRYGLHFLPTATSWTLILSRQANNWGSFSYHPSDDAARVPATATSTDFLEHLQYSMEDPSDTSATLTMRWERLAVSVPITVATRQVVLDSVTQQLHGIPQFFPQGWLEAAQWAAANGFADQAARWADSSLLRGPTFGALQLKAGVLERQGDAGGAKAARDRALAIATEADINLLGYQLLGQGKTDEAIALFRQNTRDHPNSWNTYDSLGEALAGKGDVKEARANYEKALSMAPDDQQRARIRTILAGLK
jgi:tetratricopeptide (TPR) repeat protein